MREESNRNSRILIFKNSITKVKTQQMGLITNSIEVDIERISELKGRSEEITQNEAERNKMMESTKMRRIQWADLTCFFSGIVGEEY